MMGCSCRITPMRIFVQGLAQVHQLESSASRLRSPAASSLWRNQLAHARQDRGLHGTRYLRSAEATASAADSTPTKTEDVPKSPQNENFSSSSPNPTEPSHPSSETSRPPTEDALSSLISETSQSSTSVPENTQPKKDRGKKDMSPAERHARWRTAGEPLAEPRRKKPTTASETNPKPTDDKPHEERKKPAWVLQKEALKQKFPSGWKPVKRLSPDALAGIRALNAQFPDIYTTTRLAAKFEMSPEAIRRILRSKWTPSADEEQARQERWFRRGQSVYERKAALGVKPPKRWREEGIARDPSWHLWREGAVRRNREFEEEERRVHRLVLQKRNSGGRGEG